MTETCSASSKPDAIRLRISCPDLAEYRARYLERHRARGVLIPPGRTRSRPVGSRVLLKLEMADGTLAYCGTALVRAHLKDGSQLGLVLELDGAGFTDREPRASEGSSVEPAPPPPAAPPAARDPAPAPTRVDPPPPADPAPVSAAPAARPPPLPVRREVALRLRPTLTPPPRSQVRPAPTPPPLPEAWPAPTPPPLAQAIPARTAAPGGARGPRGRAAVTAALVAGAAGLVVGAAGLWLALTGARQPGAWQVPVAGGPEHDPVDSTQRADDGRRRPGTRAGDDGAPGHSTRREAR